MSISKLVQGCSKCAAHVINMMGLTATLLDASFWRGTDVTDLINEGEGDIFNWPIENGAYLPVETIIGSDWNPGSRN